LLDDLSDFNRTRLGLGINVVPAPVDLADLLADELDELRAVHPHRQIELDISGSLKGNWDGRRLQQLFQNLIVNALKYGAPNTPVRVEGHGDATQVRIDVRNQGPVIECATLARIFEPLTRGTCDPPTSQDDGGLGLGLYIASEIAKAHQGTIEACSDATETVFSVSLPRAVGTANGH
uniref:sensor histidine kinase n=2 Tax=Paraburkholderia phenoliruptrix TaxID=252970 RepID=UPI00158FAA9A